MELWRAQHESRGHREMHCSRKFEQFNPGFGELLAHWFTPRFMYSVSSTSSSLIQMPTRHRVIPVMASNAAGEETWRP